MAKHESTAINQLLDLVQRKPIGRDDDDDLLFRAPLKGIDSVAPARARAATGTPAAPYEPQLATQPAIVPPPVPAPAMLAASTLVVSPMIAAAPTLVEPPTTPITAIGPALRPPVIPAAPLPRAPHGDYDEDSETIPSIEPDVRPVPRAASARPAMPPPSPRGRSLGSSPGPARAASQLPTRIEAALPPIALPPIARPGSLPRTPLPPGPITARHARADQSYQPTLPVRRLRDRVAHPAPVALFAVGGLLVGLAGYRALSGSTAASPIAAAASAAATIHAPAPATAPAALAAAAAAVPAAQPPALVELRLESQPAGASVTLIDGAHQTPLGTTPLSASLDPSRAYDLKFTLAGRIEKIEHVDPHASQHVDIALALPPTVAPAPAVAAAPAPARAAAPVHARRAAPAVVAAAAPASSGTGILMISSKPPCAIVVDGRATGLVTPQKSITLASGTHTITLVDAKHSLRKTYAVTIAPHRATKLVRNLMKA